MSDPREPAPVLQTRLESTDDIRRWSQQAGGAAPDAQQAVAAYRPTLRPPLAMLCIVDDGQDTGQWVRMRGDSLVIGRAEGDVRIPHDRAISNRHAEVVRAAEGGEWRWTLRDLKSTNGTFVRVTRTPLRDGQELILGGRRYRFQSVAASAEVAAAPVRDATQAWQAPAVAAAAPQRWFVELTAEGEGRRLPIDGNDTWIGSDASRCALVIENDPFVNPQHAHLYRDPRGQWLLETPAARNGTWLRIEQVTLQAPTSEFMTGEQRFIVRVP